ncbi:MAG: hypothetical protein EOO41_02510 [Methanobacteriota archaeon]|nr:MAG: hypothetical protein EOO41_02510 [Euryarchaeota archaeon]
MSTCPLVARSGEVHGACSEVCVTAAGFGAGSSSCCRTSSSSTSNSSSKREGGSSSSTLPSQSRIGCWRAETLALRRAA